MNPDCRNFRARLADALRGPRGAANQSGLGGANSLSWHAHVIHCAVCRELLSEEEALDELLRSLPVPHLPRALAERVLSRLDATRRGVDLDRLLELEQAQPAPANLARSVLARVHAERELDRLLERVVAPQAPAGLERRVIARLELARRAQRTHARPERAAALRNFSSSASRRSPPSRLALRIAAGFVLASLAAWGAWSLRRALLEAPQLPSPQLVREPTPGMSAPEVAVTPLAAPLETTIETPLATEPNEELLASLDIFEAWDLLSTTDGVDASLSTLDSLDEYLLDFETAPATASGAEGANPAAPPSSQSSSGGADSNNTKKNG
jgi:hypothetical protein